MADKQKKIEVVTTATACKLIGELTKSGGQPISRPTFIYKYKPHIKQYPSTGKANLYSREDLIKLLKESNMDRYKIVEQ